MPAEGTRNWNAQHGAWHSGMLKLLNHGEILFLRGRCTSLLSAASSD